ncbi:MAG: peptidylprolyl isomerase [Pseudomonadota bacterium]|nr:peptidylprolyl isomerase [Sphingomonas sp.]MDQ3479208.1 peptidylprolyl isomerase [Pseudomonadota bacterium]
MAASNSTRLRLRSAIVALGFGVATAAVAQTASQPAQPPAPSSVSALRLPSNPQLFGATMPSVVKATAIVNGEVITQTDVDQRLALLAIANEGEIPAERLTELRQQVLRNLIDESLQIQAARVEKITISARDIDRAITRVSENNKQSPDQLDAYLVARGSSIRTLRRQIEGELAWDRLQRAKIESSISVGEDEVKAVIDRLNASKGAREYRVGEIYLPNTSANPAETVAKANQILEQLRAGGSFVAYARQYSEASTAAVGGDLGWVRPELLPQPIAATLRTMSPGQVSEPIAIPGGVSIVAVQDARNILVADPRSAVFSLKQVSISFPAGNSRAASESLVSRFAEAAQSVGGCGGAEKIASEFNGEVVQSDNVKLRDLPTALQEIMLPMQVGQATRPFGSIEEGVRTLVICGRDETDPTMPSYDQVYAQINEERLNSRSRRFLRDLRRDAVIEFR